MTSQAKKDWYVQGLQALRSATEQDKGNPGAIADAASSLDLKEIMAGSSKVLTQHAANIAQLLQNAGGPDGIGNPIMDGIRARIGQMIQVANDPTVRYASIIAASQIAIHYFIAAYGTLASTSGISVSTTPRCSSRWGTR